MPTFKERIQADLSDAMRARDETRKTALRMLTAAVKNTEIELRHPLADDEVLAVIQKQVKQRRESIAEFERGGRQDLVAKEAGEMTLLEAYLPEQATRDEIQAAVRTVVAQTGAAGPRDMGRVMPILTKQFAGRADGRTISEVVREVLGS